MPFREAGVATLRTSDRGRAVFALRGFQPGEVVEASPVLSFPASQGETFEATVLRHHPYRWVDGPPVGDGPALNHWSLAGRENGAIVLGLGTFINHSFQPNCEYRRNFADQRLDFVAIEPIVRGDEVTVNYNGSPTNDAPIWFPITTDPPTGSPALVGTRLVRVVVAPAAGRGRCVFAAGDIRVGDVIERAPVIVLPKPDHDRLNAQTSLADYCFPWDRHDDSGALVLGYGSIYTRSHDPNTDYVRDLDAEEVVFFALRDIAEGEEIRLSCYRVSRPGEDNSPRTV